MISAIDRLYGNRGGEGVALLTLLGLSLWIAYQHMPTVQIWFDHSRAVADLAMHSLREQACSMISGLRFAG